MKSIKGELKLLFTVCAVVLCLAIALRAQQGPGGPPPGGPPTPAKELERLDKVLTLSDTQKSQILEILEKRHTEIDALMKSSSDRSASHEQMHTIFDTTNKEIRALLTESQQKLFDAMRPPKPPSNGGSNENRPSPNGESALRKSSFACET